MTEQQTNLLLFYKGWDDYQALLIKAIAPLSSAQLGLRVAPHLRSIGENVAHIISGRMSNFHIVMGINDRIGSPNFLVKSWSFWQNLLHFTAKWQWRWQGMPTTPLIALPEGLDIISVSETADELQVRVVSNRSCSLCPLCATPSDAIHSYYRRKPADLPCIGRPIRLLLTVRKFFCRNTSCPRKVFAERLPELIEPASRLTRRMREALQTIGFALNGEGGARLADRLGMPISATTLLRSLHLVPTPPVDNDMFSLLWFLL